MKTFSVTIPIHAPADTIWALLTDAPNQPGWNPTLIKIEGKIALGEKIKVWAKIAPNRAFALKVSEFVPNQRMVWVGGMPVGLFTGRRTFTLTHLPIDTVEFAMTEVFSGLMSPLIEGSLPDLQPSFNEFATALKTKAESLS